MPGRAARVAHGERLVLVELRVAVRVGIRAGEQLLVGVLDDEDVLDPRALAELLEQRHEAAVDDHRAVAGVVGDVGEIVRVQPEVERVQHEARARDPEVGLEVRVVVPRERGDAVASLETELVQRDRELPRPPAEVGVRVAVERPVGEAARRSPAAGSRSPRGGGWSAASAGSPSSGRSSHAPLLVEKGCRDLRAQLGAGSLPRLDPERPLVEAVQDVLPREADAAVDLDRALARGHGCVGGE